jgi:DNA-binding transcriptional LysR family regulator
MRVTYLILSLNKSTLLSSIVNKDATMEITKIKYFAVVAETGSLRRASELLQVSPAALSRAIKQLEAELGAELFVPSGRGIAITDRGRLLQQRAGRLLNEYESFVADTRKGDRVSAMLRIGTFEIFSTHFMGWAIDRYLRGRSVLLREMGPSEMEAALLKRDVDVAITYLPVPHEGLDFLKVASQEMAIYGRSGTFRNTPFDDLPFCVPLSPVSGAALAVGGLDGWPLQAPSRRVRHQVHMLETALNIAARGHGVLFCPPFVVQRYNELVRQPHQLEQLPYPRGMKPVKMDIYLVKRRSSPESDDIQLLTRAIRECCA